MDSVNIEINESILDFSAASYKFDQHFGAVNALSKWFEKVESAYMEEPMENFENIAVKAIDKLAKQEQKYLIKDEKEAMVKLLMQLPDHRSACEKIMHLKENGASVVAVLDKSEKRMSFKEIGQCFK